MFDRAARKGFSAETCSFLRVLEGDDRLPRPDFVVGTSEPCQQGERVLADLVRDLGCPDRYHLLHTPIHQNDRSVESIAAGLEASVAHLERSLGMKMDLGTAEGGLRAVERGPRDRHSLQPSAVHQSALAPRQRGHLVCRSCSRNCGASRSWSSCSGRCSKSCREAKAVGGTGDRHRRYASARLAASAAVLQQPADGFHRADLQCARGVRGSELRGLAGTRPGRSVSQSGAEVADRRFSRSRAARGRDPRTTPARPRSPGSCL